MLEVGNLANATEDRSHFGAWAILSSPLVLSFDLANPDLIERVWPTISNTRILEVNQRWAGDPGRRVALSTDGWQAWSKQMAHKAYAIFLMNTGAPTVHTSLPLRNVSAAFAPDIGVCLYDMYAWDFLPRLPPGAPLVAALSAHDSAFYCAWPSSSQHGACDQSYATSGCPR